MYFLKKRGPVGDFKKSIFTEKIQRIYRIQVLPETPEELESMAVKTSVKLLSDKVSAF